MQLFTVPVNSSNFLEYRTPFCVAMMLAGLGVGILGCGSPKMEPLPSPTRDTFRFATNYEGLEVAVDPYFEAGQIKKSFGADLLSHKIVPVRILFRNSRPEGAYLLQPQSVVLLAREGTTTAPGDGDVASDHIQRLDPYGDVILPGSLLFSPLSLVAVVPLGLALDESRRDAGDVARYLEYVQFQDRPLYPSDFNSGFVYFRLSSVKDLQRVSGLRFEIRNLRSQEVTPISITINGTSH